ncbi:MAG: hypothetical protein U1G05_14795 [Kiritimatiellia bacterium]
MKWSRCPLLRKHRRRHGGAANNTQAAHMQALALQFLRDKLFPAAR